RPRPGVIHIAIARFTSSWAIVTSSRWHRRMPLSEKLSRRLLLAGAAAVATGPLLVRPSRAYASSPRVPSGVFTLGIASADPLPAGAGLRSRLAPDPMNGGGMPAVAVPVDWEIALDPAFSQGRRSGVATATPGLAHSVHVDVRGLRPDTPYYYR